MKLIDKDKIVAEIEKRFDEYTSSILKHYDTYKEAKAQELGKILTIINTLETKEMDLEKESLKWVEEHQCADGFFSCIDFAKYFFELGLKAQKGE